MGLRQAENRTARKNAARVRRPRRGAARLLYQSALKLLRHVFLFLSVRADANRPTKRRVRSRRDLVLSSPEETSEFFALLTLDNARKTCPGRGRETLNATTIHRRA